MKCALTKQYNETLYELIQLAYAAAINHHQWQEFLDRASYLCGGIGIHLFGHDDATNSAQGVMYGGYDPVFTNRFDEYYGNINCWAPGFFQHDAGTTVHTELMYPQKELIKTEFYSDWCQPQGDLRTGGGVILHKEQSRMFALGGNIRKRHSEALDHFWLRLLGDITPHMQQAIEISRAFSGMHLEKVSIAETRSSHNAAVIVVSSMRRVVYANDDGNALLEKGSIVRTSLGGRFDFTDLEHSRRFESELLKLATTSTPSPLTFLAEDGKGDSYACRIAQYAPELVQRSIIEQCYLSENTYFLIALSKAVGKKEIKRLLKNHYGVTDAEAEVAIGIASGHSTADISKETRKSIHTIRNQLKRAMAKMDVTRQIDLAASIDALRKS